MTRSGKRDHLRTRAFSASILLLPVISCDYPAVQESPHSLKRAKTALRATSRTALRTDADAAALRSNAESALVSFLKAIPEGEESRFGFQSRSEFAVARLGRPYAMFALLPGPEIVFLDYWRFPVLVETEYRSLVHVERSGSDYTMVSLGGAALASDLGAQTRSLGIDDASASEDVAILRGFPYIGDFLVCPRATAVASEADEISARALISTGTTGAQTLRNPHADERSCLPLAEIASTLPRD